MGESSLSRWTVCPGGQVWLGCLRSQGCVEQIDTAQDDRDRPEDLIGTDEENRSHRDNDQENRDDLCPILPMPQPEDAKDSGKSGHHEGVDITTPGTVVDEARDRKGRG